LTTFERSELSNGITSAAPGVAKFLRIEGKQTKTKIPIKLKGTVIAGIETPLNKLARLDVNNVLIIKRRFKLDSFL